MKAVEVLDGGNRGLILHRNDTDLWITFNDADTLVNDLADALEEARGDGLWPLRLRA